VNGREAHAESAAERITLRALDGYELGAVLYPARTSETPAQQVAVLHCGSAIPAARYAGFARFLAGRGISVLTYDYRGIGLSRPPELRGFRAAIEDWAEYDSAAAIAWLRGRYPGSEITGITHSIGALLVGGAHNAGEQVRLVFIGPHTGYYGDYRPLYRLPMAALWHIVMPGITRLFGYFPASRLGLGEDVPLGIALQWAARRSPTLRSAQEGALHERTRILLDRCAALRRPTLVVHVADDAFATRAGARRLLSHYPGLHPVEHIAFSPADAGVHRIGHFGFFRRRVGAALWPRLLARLESMPTRLR
jgi:predicted alpha/beta hydrolase